MQSPLVIKQGTTVGQVGLQSGMVAIPMTVTSNINSPIPAGMTLQNKAASNGAGSSQNLAPAQVQPTIIPNVQILNMRAGAPPVAAQKSVATVSPRVVISAPQVVGTRATAPGITLQTLQSLQAGQQGHLLLKTENGQYQLLRVGPAPTASSLTGPHPQTIRLSSVPAMNGVATMSTSMAAHGPVLGQMPPPPIAAPVVAASVAGILPPMTPPLQMQMPTSTITSIKQVDNTKEKCRNFLANLLDLSSKEPPAVERNVRNLIQELIDAQVEPEAFCDRLEKLLNASPQPCLIGFLKKSLPLLRQALVTKELTIEGINPPSFHVAFPIIPAHAQTVMSTSNMQMLCDEDSSSPTLTPLLPPAPVLPMTPPLASHPKPLSVMPAHSAGVQKPPAKSKKIAVLQNIPVHTKINMSKMANGRGMGMYSKTNSQRATVTSTGLNTILTPGRSLLKDKEKRPQLSQPFVDDKIAGDDDINDVTAMGGVNLAEESQRILGSTEMIGTQVRSCKEEHLVTMSAMQARIKTAVAKYGLEEPSPEVASLLSHALHERLKNVVEKLAVISQHRVDTVVKEDPRYEPTQDVKGQLKFLEELDRVDKKRRDDSERELLMRAAKSRSKNEDPEQAKLKAKAKEMQRIELEEVRQREANFTALQAIGPRKKPRLDGPSGSRSTFVTDNGNAPSALTGRSQLTSHTRHKRINQRDMLYLMEQERDTRHSVILYKSYLK